MSFKKRRLIQAITDRAPKNAKDLLDTTQREVWPFLQQVRRLLNNFWHPDLDGRNELHQHESEPIDINDNVFDGNLVGMTTLKQAMTFLDDFLGGGEDTYKVKVDGTDATPEFLQAKLVAGDHVTITLVDTAGTHQLRLDVAWPDDDHMVSVDATDEAADGAAFLGAKLINGTRSTWSIDTSEGQRRMRVDVDASGIDDHLVKARTADATAVGGLEEKERAGVGITQTIVTDAGVERLETASKGYVVAADGDTPDVLFVRATGGTSIYADLVGTAPARRVQFDVNPSTQTPLPDSPTGSPGTTTIGTQASAWNHQHPQQSPEVEGARLYTAALAATQPLTAKGIMEPHHRWSDVRCVMLGPSSCYPIPFAGFTHVGANHWTFPTQGAMSLSRTDGVALNVGDRVLAWAPGMTVEDAWECGIYVCNDPGSVDTHADFTRATDCDAPANFIFRKSVNVLEGDAYGGHTMLYIGTTHPFVETDPLPFENHGTDSIFDVADGDYGFGSIWTAVSGSPCTWQKNGEGAGGAAQPPSATRWLEDENTPGDEVAAGERFMLFGVTGSPYDGLYEIQTYGTYQQVIRRVPEADIGTELTGLVALIDGGNDDVWLDGIYFEETAAVDDIDVDATDWDTSSENPNEPERELLTASQLTSEGASGDTVTVEKTFTGPNPTGWLFDSPFYTLANTPGIEELPAGRERCSCYARLVGWDPVANPGETKVRFQLYTWNGSSATQIFAATCPIALTNDWQMMDWYYDLASPVSMAGLMFAFHPDIVSDCADAVTVEFEYNSSARRTWIQLAGLAFPVAGTDRHDLLTWESRELPHQHPWSAIGPEGRSHVKLGTATLTGSGTTRMLVMPSDCSVAKLVPTTSEVVYGIDRTGFSVAGVDTSDEIRLLVQATGSYNVTFVHSASGMGGDAMFLGDSGTNVACKATTMLVFYRDPTTGSNGIWRRPR